MPVFGFKKVFCLNLQKNSNEKKLKLKNAELNLGIQVTARRQEGQGESV